MDFLQSLSIRKTTRIYNSCVNTTAINNRNITFGKLDREVRWLDSNRKRTELLDSARKNGTHSKRSECADFAFSIGQDGFRGFRT